MTIQGEKLSANTQHEVQKVSQPNQPLEKLPCDRAFLLIYRFFVNSNLL